MLKTITKKRDNKQTYLSTRYVAVVQQSLDLVRQVSPSHGHCQCEPCGVGPSELVDQATAGIEK